MEKKTEVYGVTMTSLEEMKFDKYRDSNGIAMNTKTEQERKTITENWLSNQSN